jgi:hypothetical protein
MHAFPNIDKNEFPRSSMIKDDLFVDLVYFNGADFLDEDIILL